MIPKQKKKAYTVTVNPKIMEMVNESFLERTELKNRSQAIEKFILFVMSNEEKFVECLRREESIEKAYEKAYKTRDKEKFMELFLIDPFKIKNSISP